MFSNLQPIRTLSLYHFIMVQTFLSLRPMLKTLVSRWDFWDFWDFQDKTWNFRGSSFVPKIPIIPIIPCHPAKSSSIIFQPPTRRFPPVLDESTRFDLRTTAKNIAHSERLKIVCLSASRTSAYRREFRFLASGAISFLCGCEPKND